MPSWPGKDGEQQWRAFVLAGLAAVLCLAALLPMGRGIDLTDEGAYLNCIAHPELYPFSFSQFGRFTHPLWVLFGHDVVMLRAGNCLVLLALMGVLVARIFDVTPLGATLRRAERLGFGAAFTTGALLFYCIWLPTPSYNSWNLIGGLLFAIGATGWRRKRDDYPVMDTLILALGLSTCFLMKPTTGALLALLTPIAAFGALKRKALLTLGAGVVSAGIVSAYLLVFMGTPDVIVRNYALNLELATVATGQTGWSNLLWRSAPFPRETLHIAIVLLLSAALYAALAGWPKTSRLWRWAIGVAALSGIAVACAWVQFTGYADSWNRPASWTPALMAIAFAMVSGLGRERVDWGTMGFAAMLFAAPFAVGFGSNTGMTRSATQAAPIWIAFALMLVASCLPQRLIRSALATLAFMTLATSATVVSWAEFNPQRQIAPLWRQHVPIAAYGRAGALQVDAATAAYFDAFSAAAAEHGFTRGTPILDLTGASPVTVYVLGGRAIGWAYLSAGYPGSQPLLERVIAMSSKRDVTGAWLLTAEKDGLSPDALAAVGRSFPGDYEAVARAVPGVGGERTLWRPRLPPEA